MEIEIPAIPAGVILLLGFFAPYAVGALNAALKVVKTSAQRRIVSILVSLVLALVVIGVYLLYGNGLPPLSTGALIVLAVLIVAGSYALVTKGSAQALEARIEQKR